jgi:tetratricopeptide (TPR) repeat protein
MPAPPPKPTELLAMAATDPAAVLRLGPGVLRQALEVGDQTAAVAVERALGLAAREVNDLQAAVRHLRLAIRLAEGGNLDGQAAQGRVNLAGALILRGDLPGALRELDLAAPSLRGSVLAQAEANRATVLYAQGRLDEALDGYQRALPVLERAGDLLAEANLRNNRGMIHYHRGALQAAASDLIRAEQLYASLGMGIARAEIHQNLGYVAARQGDLPAALTWFDRADEEFRRHGLVDAVGLRDRAEALLAGGLVVEGRRAAEQAVRRLGAEHRSTQLAEARLLLSHAALLDGDVQMARSEADQARRAFARQGRRRWLAMARLAEVRAAWLAGERSLPVLATARRAADAMQAAGWAVPAMEARLIGAHLALDLGRPEIARGELAQSRQARWRGPVELRSRAWHAEALLRLAAGNRRGAEAALRAGLRVLDTSRATLGATDLRAHAATHGAALARLGLRLALEERNPRRLLAWAERWRGGSLQLRPVRPPRDQALADALTRLRQVVAELDEAALGGRTTSELLRRQAALEKAIQQRARHAAGQGLVQGEPVPAVPELARELGDRALVELIEHDGRLHAVVLAGGRATLHDLATLAEVRTELDSLRFALLRLALGHGPRRSLQAATGALAFGAGRLDELLLGPLEGRTRGRPLVLVPTGPLHALPWAALPSCAGRPVAIAPSAALWRRVATGGRAQDDHQTGTVLVAGPGLAAAADEIAELSTRYPAGRCLTGPEATAGAVSAALGGASLAHVAAHGRFRADNPLLSSLQLADGPLTVYDLEGLERPPGCLVLSACDSGVSDVRPGDELMGLAAALFALGTRTLIASVLPVADAATRPLMLALHDGFALGMTPAEALARAQAAPIAGGDAMAAAASFVCFGAG